VIVLDSSAAVEYLTEPDAIGEWVRTTIEHEQELAAPDIVDLEVASAIRKKVARGELTVRGASEAIATFLDLAVVRYPLTNLLLRVWGLRRTLSPYDAAYIVLAEALEGVLVTTDQRLARSRGHRARVVAYPA
jgi:predicted nucleic acid-binding protein